MTDDEWDAFVATLVDCFQGGLTEQEQKSYRAFLGTFGPAALLNAAAELVHQGKVFMPKPGEIVAAMYEAIDEAVPEWAEAWDLIQRAMTVGCKAKGKEAVKQAAAVEFLEAQTHPIVARFYEVKGHGWLSKSPFFDPDYGALRLRDLEREWNGFVEVGKERLRTGRALESMGTRKSLGPSRLDQAALSSWLRRAHGGELEAGA